jgi:uncharacterized integral membrane protein
VRKEAVVDRRNDGDPAAPSQQAEPGREARPREPEKQRVFVGTGLFWGLILGLLLAAALVIFIFQNTQTVEVEWLGFTFTAPLIGLLLATALIAVIVDQIAGLLFRRRRRRLRTEREELQRLRGQESA